MVLEAERKQITGHGRTKTWELEREGKHPRRRIISGNRVGWLLSELIEYIHGYEQGGPEAPKAALEAAAKARVERKAESV